MMHGSRETDGCMEVSRRLGCMDVSKLLGCMEVSKLRMHGMEKDRPVGSGTAVAVLKPCIGAVSRLPCIEQCDSDPSRRAESHAIFAECHPTTPRISAPIFTNPRPAAPSMR